MRRQAGFTLISFFLLLGCNYTKLKDANGGSDNSKFSLPADQRKDLSYSLVAGRVFTPKCVSCHGNSGNVSLETFSDVVRHLDGVKKTVFETHTMPKRGSINDQEMSLLWTWIEMGAPEKAPGEGPGTPPEPLEPTYASLYQNVFKPKCVTCHSPGNTGSRIPLTEEGLLNSPLELIIPGNPDESGLVVAVERNDDKRMPPAKEGYSKLKDEEKAAIRAWIEKISPPAVNPSPGNESSSPRTPAPDLVLPTFDSLNDRIFQARCITCHAAGKTAARVPLTKQGLLDSPLELVIPGNPDESGVVVAVERGDDNRMPPPKDGFSSIKENEKQALREWIKNGAKD